MLSKHSARKLARLNVGINTAIFAGTGSESQKHLEDQAWGQYMVLLAAFLELG
jgi:hypothetical protein